MSRSDNRVWSNRSNKVYFGNYVNGNMLVSLDRFKIKYRTLKFNDTKEIYDFPDVIEIKITNKCIYECSICSRGSYELGENTINPDLFNKLSELPNSPITFIISGGSILENLKDLYKLTEFLNEHFKGCRIILNINSLDIPRFENLSKTFGNRAVRSIYDNALSIFLTNNEYSIEYLMDPMTSSVDNFIIFRVNYNIFPIYYIKQLLYDNRYKKKFCLVVEGKTPTDKEKSDIYNLLNELRNLPVFSSVHDNILFFEESVYKSLNLGDVLGQEDAELYNIGHSNYLFIDAVEGTFGKNNKTSWNNIKLLDFYHDTYNK